MFLLDYQKRTISYNFLITLPTISWRLLRRHNEDFDFIRYKTHPLSQLWWVVLAYIREISVNKNSLPNPYISCNVLILLSLKPQMYVNLDLDTLRCSCTVTNDEYNYECFRRIYLITPWQQLVADLITYCL